MCQHELSSAQGRLDREAGRLNFVLVCDHCGADAGEASPSVSYAPDPKGTDWTQDPGHANSTS